MVNFLKPKEFNVTDQDGIERTYTISKFPAVDGREIVAKYPIAALPKLGDYKTSEETMLKLMCYVAVDLKGSLTPLTTRGLVNNHVPDFETLAKIEMAMMEYNCSFFRDGRLSITLQGFVQSILAAISKISMASSAPSSQETKQPSTNSEPSTI